MLTIDWPVVRAQSLRSCIALAWILAASVLVAACGKPEGTDSAPEPVRLTAQDIELNNRGVALMGYFDYAGAREAFREAVDRQPRWADAKVNLAIATLNRQMDGDEVLARGYLAEVLAENPDHLRAHFVSGLLSERAGEADKAKQHYQTVLESDPQDAYAAYYLAVLTQTEDPDTARALFERAIAIDPYLRSAYYGAFLLNVRSGKREAGLEMQAIYERLADNPRARLAETKYTRMGPKANALAVGLPTPQPATIPEGPLFMEPQIVATFAIPQDRSLTTVDLRGNGLQDIFIANAEGASQVVLAGEDEYRQLESHPLMNLGALTAVAWADIDNDGEVDLAACGSDMLTVYFKTGTGEWASTQRLNGLIGGKRCSDLQLLDADHDGDLDLFVAFDSGGHDVLSNNGDRSFRSLRAERTLALSDRAGRNLVAADLDSDRDTDLLVVNAGGVDVLFNDRLWDYTPMAASGSPEGPVTLAGSDLLALTAADANADGRVELYGVTSEGQLRRWTRDGTSGWSNQTLASASVTADARVAMDVSDFNGDGTLDLLLVDASGFRVLSLDDGDVTTLYEFEGTVTSAMHLVADADKGPSILALVESPDGQRLLRFPPGTGRGKFASLTLKGQEELADSMRSNRSGVGTRVAVRRGSSWTILDSFDRHTGRGQSSQPMSVGLGNDDLVDYIAIDWSDGVFQTELNLAAGQQHDVTETQRQLSSCPVLFAWNGQEWDFVSDVLGVGGIGFLYDPAAQGAARYVEPRPWEFFAMPEGALQPLDGRIRMKITEPMEELALLDYVQMVAYDLAPGWNLILDERMVTGGPMASGKAMYYRNELRPSRAYRDDGLDLTDSVAHTDFVAADLGDAHPRFLGMLETPHTLTIEFDESLDARRGPLLLKATGWVEYPYSQTVFAAWQTGALYLAPSLEAGDSDGNWTLLYENFGYPAGMPREMSVPLGDLPPGTTRLRLSSNLEIYWDQLSIVEVEQPPEQAIVTQFLDLREAELMHSGFPKRIEQPQRRPDYDFSQRVPFWDTRYPKGYYTKLGDVKPLLENTDGAFVIVGPGEDVELAFDEPRRANEGWSRRYVFFVSGYAKDMDMYTQDSGTVGPLPQPPSADTALHNLFNTRYRDGH